MPALPSATAWAAPASGAIWPPASSPTSCRRRTCCIGSTAASSTPSCISAQFPRRPRPTATSSIETNFRLPLRLLDWATATRTPFIYASSAATYGDGQAGYSDDWANGALKLLQPRNLYGWSKHLFDLAVVERVARKEKLPPQWAGLKFFNVFGPNEYHKGEMMSLVAKNFDDAKNGKAVRLFKSLHADVADGGQKRDFIYVEDAVAVMRWLVETPRVSGIFNVGTGQARTFRDLIAALFAALGNAPAMEYIDMPASMRESYQEFTEADIGSLRRAGYNADFLPLEAAVKRYVTGYLDRPDRYR